MLPDLPSLPKLPPQGLLAMFKQQARSFLPSLPVAPGVGSWQRPLGMRNPNEVHEFRNNPQVASLTTGIRG